MQEWCDLAEVGITGNTRLVEVGGVPYMMDPKYNHVTFNMTDVVRACSMDQAMVFGAAAASKGNFIDYNLVLEFVFSIHVFVESFHFFVFFFLKLFFVCFVVS